MVVPGAALFWAGLPAKGAVKAGGGVAHSPASPSSAKERPQPDLRGRPPESARVWTTADRADPVHGKSHQTSNISTERLQIPSTCVYKSSESASVSSLFG